MADVHYLNFKKEENTNGSLPANAATEEKRDAIDFFDFVIPESEFRIRTSKIGKWDSKNLRCSCCNIPCPDLELEYLQYYRRDISGCGVLYEWDFHPMFPPLVAHCCEKCQSSARRLIRKRLRQRAKENGSWVRMD